MGPLAGLKVIDLTHIMAGPTCTLMLADMGADVIKIEKLPGGDDTRRSIPPTVGPPDKAEAAAFMMMNRNKRGMVLNLKTDSGREVLKRLLKTADVLVENYRPGALSKLGLAYETLREDNPGLIYCALSGFGRSGPYADKRGFDLMAQAMSGIMSITGEGPERPRLKCGAPLTDITAGILAAMGILAAYVHRLKTGQGQMVESSLLEAGITHTYWQSAIAFATGVAPGPMGSAHPLSAPYQAFDTADGRLVIGGSNQSNWLRMTQAMNAPELAADPRFRENKDRMEHLAELQDTLAGYFKQRTTAEWLELFDQHGVPAGPVYDMLDMHQDPQVLARDMVVEVEHKTLGPVKTLGLPVKFSDTPGKVQSGAPIYGQHTRDILLEYGYTEAEIQALLEEQAIVVAED